MTELGLALTVSNVREIVIHYVNVNNHDQIGLTHLLKVKYKFKKCCKTLQGKT